ncbi:hypothetical protein E2C01_061952 [Portunus trituberculatus]|uniref:Uncharacterized protein n=1 Tax=Portunus trituberculatus TaxID=210409 RepID=A0A5B7HFR9_PORTR|nr:hypothetical protein [Portunus trituberculatus]
MELVTCSPHPDARHASHATPCRHTPRDSTLALGRHCEGPGNRGASPGVSSILSGVLSIPPAPPLPSTAAAAAAAFVPPFLLAFPFNNSDNNDSMASGCGRGSVHGLRGLADEAEVVVREVTMIPQQRCHVLCPAFR